MGLILKTGLKWDLLKAGFLSIILISLIVILINLFKPLRNRITSSTLQLGASLGNSGYFGIPVALALLPNSILNISIGYDIGAKFICWTLGPFLINKGNESFSVKSLLKNIINSPASKGLLGVIILQLTPWSDKITSLLWIPSRIIIFLALIIVGIRLALILNSDRPIINPFGPTLRATLIIKLIGMPLLMLIFCKFLALDSLSTRALVLQASSPTAISVLLLAEANNNQPDYAGSLVAWSTLISLLTIPLISQLTLHFP